jgi:predicted Zn finger-like uncharacterized protein
MIITCPECETRFMISDQALGDEGRTVRCSKCAHTWFQSPDDVEDSGDLVDVEEGDVLSEEMDGYEDSVEDDENDDGQFPIPSDEMDEEPEFEVPIPEAIHPRSESLIEEEKDKATASTAHKYGLIASFIVFLCLVAALYVLRPVIVSAYSPSVALYQLFGITDPVPGKDLIFERLQAYEWDNAIEINGQIVNMNPDEEQSVPPLAIALVSRQDKILGHVYIKLKNDVIPAGQVYRFREVIANDGNLASAIIMRFALNEEMPKPKVEATQEEVHDDIDDSHTIDNDEHVTDEDSAHH